MIRHCNADELRRVPWRNGRGTTLEIASDAVDGGPWSWRCSIADVPESGPFSRFDGCERLIVCVDGNGMRLLIDGAAAIDVPRTGEALRFPGEAATVGELVDGPVRDANLMVQRERWSGTLAIVEGSLERRVEAAAITIVVALRGTAAVADGAMSVALGTGDAAIVSGAAGPTRVRVDGAAIVARVIERDAGQR